jgi:hypothetical protein
MSIKLKASSSITAATCVVCSDYNSKIDSSSSASCTYGLMDAISGFCLGLLKKIKAKTA